VNRDHDDVRTLRPFGFAGLAAGGELEFGDREIVQLDDRNGLSGKECVDNREQRLRVVDKPASATQIEGELEIVGSFGHLAKVSTKMTKHLPYERTRPLQRRIRDILPAAGDF
jgi:hypothetical protein